MRKLYFLVPGTDGKFACGGLWAELKTLNLAKEICDAQVVTYRQREKDKLFLDDVLQQQDLQQAIFVISWGFDVAKLAPRLKSYNVVYHAHSAGYGFKLPASIPIITVSRNTLGYWGQLSPHSLIYYLPNQISDEFTNQNLERDIDVLVLARKSSEYLIKDLVPALQPKCKLELIDYYIEDIPALFNRAKIYIYDSAEYWAQQRVTEGFGLQPMEAAACGCQIFSSLNGGLSDYLDPGFNSYKIAAYSKEYDMQRILKLLQDWSPSNLPESFFQEYRRENIIPRFQVILSELNEFFDHKQNHQSNIQPLTKMRLTKLSTQRILNKIKKKLQ
ncbi:glycosyltransferase [Rivularia sp. PCC 7116]|uniref:glycosyltransferase n=1 Tax=Rivularia sp. PCC 7116 TaxID=373994 RepID=UPI00029F243A|nr:glycosyltransferase [Rivularia sp. PCC 7116]AFY58424.1 glycosyltransferase [Rivularia sp. PCC 7116]